MSYSGIKGYVLHKGVIYNSLRPWPPPPLGVGLVLRGPRLPRPTCRTALRPASPRPGAVSRVPALLRSRHPAAMLPARLPATSPSPATPAPLGGIPRARRRRTPLHRPPRWRRAGAAPAARLRCRPAASSPRPTAPATPLPRVLLAAAAAIRSRDGPRVSLFPRLLGASPRSHRVAHGAARAGPARHSPASLPRTALGATAPDQLPRPPLACPPSPRAAARASLTGSAVSRWPCIPPCPGPQRDRLPPLLPAPRGALVRAGPAPPAARVHVPACPPVPVRLPSL
eukprot:325872-Pleurochrysis_carterae.AAC.1